MSLAIRCGMLVVTAALSSCVANPYEIGFDGAALPPDGGDAGVEDLFVPPDAEPDGVCVPAAEICNGEDDDCDGQTDNVPGERLESDPRNCGACGNRCFENNTTCGKCVEGECQFDCCPGKVDCEPDTGELLCETSCVPSLGGIEECDGLDNDCDCETDEGFDLMTDPDNCGECGRVCKGANAVASCVAGDCVFVCNCDIDGVDPDNGCFANVLPIPPGCEYRCSPGPIEGGPYPDLDPRDDDGGEDEPESLCNAIDDDCDGLIDDGNPGGGLDCGETEGECEAGKQTCSFGTLVCSGGVGPVSESCNNLDDDCDGVTDNGFDKLSDPRYCGDCTPCVRPNTFTRCNAGICEFVACHPGWVDTDSDGFCDYECTPSGPEICDGIDNNCDTVTDEGVVPPLGLCLTFGACAGTIPTCTGLPAPCDETVRWRCLYQPPAELDACGVLKLQEEDCDDIDGDCDGVVDDHRPLKGAPCDDGGLGVCRSSGNYVCAADPRADVECDYSSPGDSPGPEICDGIDNNCDGSLDLGAPNAMVHVQTGGLDFWIDAYESSRPDATDIDEGFDFHRSCSNPGVIPWTGITRAEAAQACANAGYRLCTEAEWQEACEGASGFQYPYGDVYDPNACNGEDYDPDCVGFDEDELLPTGTPHGCPTKPLDSACVAEHNGTDWIYDLSGNAKEWTSTQVGSAPNVTWRVRGGAYDNAAGALACDFDFLSFEDGFLYENLGFRCCSTTGP